MSAAASSPLYARRRLVNVVAMTAAFIATGIGIMWLVLILATLLTNGISALSLSIFVQTTPPPGSAGGLANAIYGSIVTYNFAKVKAILVVNLSATAADVLRVGGAGAGVAFATPFNGSATAQLEVPAEGCLLLVNKKNGWAVTAGTGDILRIQNPGASAINYRIAIVGTRT